MNVTPALPAIEEAIRAATGNAFRIAACENVAGGSIHHALAVTDGRARYFVKVNTRDALTMFEAEADGLAAIAATGTFRTPAVVAAAGADAHAFLILEHLSIRPLASPEDGVRFGAALAALHRVSGEHFGWHRDNHIGRTPQANPQADNWARFFVEHRLRPQFALAQQAGYGQELRRAGERLLERVPALFLDYRPLPSLLHGDLWHGNAGVTPTGEPVLFDPACHFGDRESDLAMSELFGGFPTAFYAAYRHAWPLNADYEQRKPLYSLYHILNHLNLFGRGYLNQARRMAAALCSMLER